MLKWLTTLHAGAPIVVVSGLPRSGTSMMMRMLHAGGMGILSDGERGADVDNPHGYFELRRIMELENETDKSYLRAARGRAVKVVSFLIKDLPPTNRYQVVFMRRHLDEVLASQNKMIARRGVNDSTDDDSLRQSYLADIARARVLSRRRPYLEMVEIEYGDAVANPAAVARQVCQFLGRTLDVEAMAAAVDASLYRNRVAS